MRSISSTFKIDKRGAAQPTAHPRGHDDGHAADGDDSPTNTEPSSAHRLGRRHGARFHRGGLCGHGDARVRNSGHVSDSRLGCDGDNASGFAREPNQRPGHGAVTTVADSALPRQQPGQHGAGARTQRRYVYLDADVLVAVLHARGRL